MMRLIVCDVEFVCSVAERQVARFRDAQRGFDRLEVAHFADEDDVGVFTQCGAQRVAEALGVAVHLALIDQTALVLVHEFDRVLDRENVIVALLVDLVEHRRERRRLTGSRRPGDEHESTRPLCERGENRRQAQFLEAADLLGDQSIDCADRAALVEHVHAEARETLDTKREVELEGLFEPLLLRIGEHAVGELLRIGRRQCRTIQACQVAMDSDLGRRVRGDVEVRSLHLHQRLQQFRQCLHYFTVSRTISSIVVTPSFTFLSPLARSVSMPSSTALRRSSSAEAPTSTSSRISSVISMTS